jgi:hypothetical protein
MRKRFDLSTFAWSAKAYSMAVLIAAPVLCAADLTATNSGPSELFLLGVGLVWSQPASTSKTVYHENEYVLEAFYTLQLSPTIRLQPDLQVVWNPAFNRDAGPAVVSQVQLVLAW